MGKRMTLFLVGGALALFLVACQGGGGEAKSPRAEAPSGSDTRSDINLSFTLDGDRFHHEPFQVVFGKDLRSMNVNYWISFATVEETAFGFEGACKDWLVHLHFKPHIKKLGIYEFKPEHLNQNLDFYIRLQKKGESQGTRYTAQSARVELTDYDKQGDYISGTFGGRFFRGSMSQEAERTYVTVSDGKFRVNWGSGQRITTKTKW